MKTKQGEFKNVKISSWPLDKIHENLQGSWIFKSVENQGENTHNSLNIGTSTWLSSRQRNLPPRLSTLKKAVIKAIMPDKYQRNKLPL